MHQTALGDGRPESRSVPNMARAPVSEVHDFMKLYSGDQSRARRGGSVPWINAWEGKRRSKPRMKAIPATRTARFEGAGLAEPTMRRYDAAKRLPECWSPARVLVACRNAGRPPEEAIRRSIASSVLPAHKVPRPYAPMNGLHIEGLYRAALRALALMSRNTARSAMPSTSLS